MGEQESSKVRTLAFIMGLAAFALASLYANGLMLPAQSLVLVVLAVSAVVGVVAASLEGRLDKSAAMFEKSMKASTVNISEL